MRALTAFLTMLVACGQAGAFEAGATSLEVVPTGTLADAENLQAAVDNVAPGGTVRLAPGTFYLGEDDARRTVVIRKGLRLEGAAPGGQPTIIFGGGASFPWGIPATGAWTSKTPAGPFWVSVASPGESVSFVRLEFRRWANQAILADAADGLSVIDCKFTDPVAVPMPSSLDESSPAIAGLTFIHALLIAGPQMRGRFEARGNYVDYLTNYVGYLSDQTQPLAEDEQFLCLYFTSFDEIRIERNVIRGHDEGLEVLRNKLDMSEYGLAAPSPGPSTISITDNAIELLHIPFSNPMKWPGMAGMIVTGNINVASATIEHNDVTITGTPLSFAFYLSGSNLIVRENRIALLPLAEGLAPTGAFLFGLGGKFAGGAFSLGASLEDSLVEDNVFRGQDTGPTILFYDPVPDVEPNTSRGNHISLDQSTTALGGMPTILLSPLVRDNTFAGHCGTVVDLGEPGDNTYLGANCLPPGH